MDPDNRKNLMALGIAVVLVALTLFVLHLFSRNMATERCLVEGRRDCTPVQGGG